jgi:hypothetical protein
MTLDPFRSFLPHWSSPAEQVSARKRASLREQATDVDHLYST